MKTLELNKYHRIAFHLLFWIISFNIFNSFFSRGIESGYVLDDLDLTVWNMLFISNIIIVFLLAPFIWVVKGFKKWVKWSVSSITAVMLIVALWSVIHPVDPKTDSIIIFVIVVYFLENFLYVLTFHITIIGAVYFNAKILIPKYLTTGKFVIYLLSVLGLALLSGYMNYALFDLFIDKIFPQFYYISWFKGWELSLLIAGYLAITTTIFLLWQYWLMLIANREKARNELSALKAQINPHFLFNNLNTIYDLAERGDQRTKEVILQLSDFLRYVLYDTSSEKIDLEKEVEIIKTYVGLQKERINSNTTEVMLNIEGDFGNRRITPLLLLPLAENCFKHGIGNKKGTIEIDIELSGHQFSFKTKNRIERRENPLNHEEGGIGILNVEKRLNLLYPNKYSLKFEESGDLFLVDLAITLE